MMQDSDLLTVAEVAADLRLHPVTIQKFCRDGKLPCSRVGRSYRIPRAAFEEFKRGAAVEPKAVSIEPTLEPELSSLVTVWLHHLEHGPRPCARDTIQTHRRNFYRYVRALLGTDPGATVTYQEVASETALLRVMTRIPPARYASRYNLFMAVMSFSRFLLERGLMDEAERSRMKRHKPKRLAPARRTVLNSLDEVNRFFEAIWLSEASSNYEKTLNAAAFGIMAFAGLRSSEVAALEVAHVDLINRILYVNHGKGGKSRMVGINHRLKGLIEDYLRVRPDGDSPVLLLGSTGTPLDRDRLSKRIRRIAGRAGLSVTCHGLRRAFATINANAGKSLNLIQLALGHASISTTQTYLMADQRTAARAMQEW